MINNKFLVKIPVGYLIATTGNDGEAYFLDTITVRENACEKAGIALNSNAIDLQKTRRRLEDTLRKNPALVISLAQKVFGGCVMEV